MPQEVIEITEREVEIIEVIERGPVGPTGPQPDINYEVVSSARTLEAADLIAADTSGGAFTLTLPANPSNGDAVDIFDFSETFDTNPLTIARNGQPIESLNEDLVANVEGAYFTLIYTGSTRGWQVLPRYGTSGGGGESALTTQGDMLYRGVGINTRLPIGTAGQVLKVNSGATAPEWGEAPATGVTSVGVSGSDGIEVDSGSPVTGSGTIALGINAASLRSHINVADGANNYTHPNHSGDVTSVGDGATTIANDAVTNAKLANVATATIKGRATAGAGDPEDLSASQVRTILNVADGAEVNVQSNWTEADSGSDAFILNKPTLGGAAALNVGTTTGTVAAGDDARLSDSRTPSSHASSHASAGSDPLFDQDLNTTDSPTFTSVSAVGNIGTLQMDDYGLVWEGARRWDVETSTFQDGSEAPVLVLPSSDPDSNPIQSYAAISFSGANAATNAATTLTNLGAASDDHVHGNINSSGQVGTTANLPLKTGTGGIVETGVFGTGAGEFAEGDHTHADLHTRSHAITSTSDHTAGNHKVFYSDGSGQIQELALGNSGEVLTSNGASAAPSFAAASGGIGGSTGSTDNSLLRSDGTGGATAQDSPFVIPDNDTASPNNTVNHASIQATGGSTNVSVSIVPKGTGAFMLSVPDGTAAGGNARGSRAVDLQRLRDTAIDVASGAGSVIGGGYYNRASASNAVVAGGWQCVASQDYTAVCGGQRNTASDYYAFVGGGTYNTASGDSAVVCGGGSLNVVSGNTASADMSAILGGLHGLADRYGLQAHGAGRFSSTGDAQRIRAVLRCKTTTDSAVEMALNGSTTYLTIPSGKVIFCNIKVVGVKSDGSAVATYERQYAAKNVAGTSSEVYAAVTIGTDNAASTSLAITTEDTGDYISIKPTGIASETWRWVASVDAVEVAYGS